MSNLPANGQEPGKLPLGLGPGALVFMGVFALVFLLATVGYLSEHSQAYLAWMLFSALAFIVTPFTMRSKTSATLRQQLPDVLDAFAQLIESGTSAPAALEEAVDSSMVRCPQLCMQLKKAVQDYKINRTPLEQTLAEIGRQSEVEELNNLAACLAAADASHSSLAYQIREQAEALRYRLEAERLAGSTPLGSSPRQAILRQQLDHLEQAENEKKHRSPDDNRSS